MTGRRAAVTAAVAALALTGLACGDDSPTSATTDTKSLEVVSWWTSGSEATALDTLFAAFRQSNPGVDAVNGAVAGGADRERPQEEHGARRHAGDDQEQPDGRPPSAADHQREAEPDHAATGDVTIRPSRTVTSRRA